VPPAASVVRRSSPMRMISKSFASVLLLMDAYYDVLMNFICLSWEQNTFPVQTFVIIFSCSLQSCSCCPSCRVLINALHVLLLIPAAPSFHFRWPVSYLALLYKDSQPIFGLSLFVCLYISLAATHQSCLFFFVLHLSYFITRRTLHTLGLGHAVSCQLKACWMGTSVYLSDLYRLCFRVMSRGVHFQQHRGLIGYVDIDWIVHKVVGKIMTSIGSGSVFLFYLLACYIDVNSSLVLTSWSMFA
jgi:hypothetical protein